MRILHVGNGNLKHHGQRYYDQTFKVNNGFTRNGHHVFFISDRDIARSGNIFGTKSLGVRYTNKCFIETCYNLRPEFILFSHADIISADSIRKVREFLPNTRIAQWNVDPIFCVYNINQIKSKLPVIDATFITTAGAALKKFSTAHGKVTFVPNIVDKSIDWPECFNYTDQKYDVFWALRGLTTSYKSYKGDPRIEIPLFLEKNTIKIDYHGMNNKPLLYSADYYTRIADTKMGLSINMSRSDINTIPNKEDLYLYSSDRISHYTGSGLLTFAQRDNSLYELYKENEELVFFDSREDLLEKIKYFQQHEDQRQRIAKNGWLKAHSCFNEKLVTQYVLETTFDINQGANYAWPTEKY